MNVVSIVRSTTRWVELQTKLFRKFCGVNVIYVNHGPNHDAMQQDFDRLGVVSHKMNLPERKMWLKGPKGMYIGHSPSESHSVALKWVAMRYLRECDDDLMIVDMDIFPIKPVDLCGLLQGVHIAGQAVTPTPRHWHFWPGLLLISRDAPKRHEIKFDACRILNHVDAPESERWLWLDSGGETILWLADAKPNVRLLSERQFHTNDLPHELQSQYDERYLFEMKEESFFHIRAATNWLGLPAELHDARENLAEAYLRGLAETVAA